MTYFKIFIVFVVLSIIHIIVAENAEVLVSFYKDLQTIKVGNAEYDLVKHAFDCQECYVVYSRSNGELMRIVSAEMMYGICAEGGQLIVHIPSGKRKNKLRRFR